MKTMKQGQILHSLYISRTQVKNGFRNSHWKIRFKGYLLLITILFFSGCSDWLDLKPESEIILDDFWQSESQAESVVAGCYKALTSDNCMKRMILWGEGRSDNVGYYETDDDNLRRMVNFDINANNDYCKWGPFYTIINYCNTFLYYAPGVKEVDPNFTDADLKTLEAEVLTIRALIYFYLVRVYKNVPWIDKPTTSDQQNFYIPQSPESVIISNIIKDLETALLNARSKHSTTEHNKGRITKNAVMALLADIYLWDQQYDRCIQMCDGVLADPELKLVNTEMMLYQVFYKGNSSESIFELQFGEGEESKQYNKIINDYYGSASNASPDLALSPFLVNVKDNKFFNSTKSPFNLSVGNAVESENDIRQKDFIFLTLGLATGEFPIFKYAGVDRIESSDGLSSSYYYRNNSANWIIYRLSDVMLMKAEALVQLYRSESDLREALALVNTTYLRSNNKEGYDSLKIENYQNQVAVEKLVLRERQRELLFEGKRWFDLMRRARRVGTVAPLLEFVSEKFSEGSGTQINSNSILDALYLPVHQKDLDANPELKQNPYYELPDTY
jgi:hypothetical protein